MVSHDSGLRRQRNEGLLHSGEIPPYTAGDSKARGMRPLQLNAATQIEDLRLPLSNRLEQLHGDRAGQWSIRINDQWRLCFRFKNGDVFDMAIVDYH